LQEGEKEREENGEELAKKQKQNTALSNPHQPGLVGKKESE
jgi:hypothetical protein